MSEETTHQRGDMRFNDEGEIVMYDGEDWVEYRRLPPPTVASSVALRDKPSPEPDETARPGDERAADADG